MNVEEEDDDVEEDDVEEEDRSQDREAHLVRACAVEMHMDMSPEASPAEIYSELAQSKCTWTCQKRHFVQKFTGEMPDLYPGASILCEPAQSKSTWTCHKTYFARKFTGKMPNASATTSIEHRGLTLTVRTHQCGGTVWGKKG